MAAPSQPSKTPISQRTHKANPVIQTRDVAAQRRRDMFFRRVQKNRDDKKWDTRGEQIERLDFISDQKRWEAGKARQAPELEYEHIDENIFDEVTSSQVANSAPQTQQEMEEAEYILAQEEYELQQMIASMEEYERPQDTMSQHYGSDDEDYDQLFMECTAADTEQQHMNAYYDGDCMDMTDG